MEVVYEQPQSTAGSHSKSLKSGSWYFFWPLWLLFRKSLCGTPLLLPIAGGPGLCLYPSSSPALYLLGDPLLFCGFKHLLYEASAPLSPQLEPLFWAPDICLQLSAEQPHSDVWKIINS